MASLLDLFSGDNADAMVAVGSGLLNRNPGAGFMAAQSLLAQRPYQRLQQQLLQAQIGETMAQADERKQKLEMSKRRAAMEDSFLNGTPQPAQMGQLGSGSFGIVPPPAGQPAIPQGGGLLAEARRLGIPEMAIQSDIVFNGGKGIAEMVYKRGTPSMKVSGGYAYDENKLPEGFIPQVNFGRDGQGTVAIPGPNNIPVISAPPGALTTYGQYKDIEARTAAGYDPVTVHPAGQPPQMTTRGALVSGLPGGTRIPPAQQAAMDRDRVPILQNELRSAEQRYNQAIQARDQTAAARAKADMEGLQRELGGVRATVGLPLASAADKKREELAVENDAKTTSTLTGEASQSRDVMANINRARELLKLGPTASGIGALTDSALSFGGMTTTSGNIASALDNVSGWLTANVPRMEGPQSNFDVQNYETMAGRVGNRNLPVPQRLAALDELERMQKKYERFNGTNDGGTVPGQKASQVLDTLPKTAPKGQRVRDTATGKILRFNGISWVEEK